eukprot:COSAG05_NODE_1682_length_4285_cov_33.861682_4_plen_83_part_00
MSVGVYQGAARRAPAAGREPLRWSDAPPPPLPLACVAPARYNRSYLATQYKTQTQYYRVIVCLSASSFVLNRHIGICTHLEV